MGPHASRRAALRFLAGLGLSGVGGCAGAPDVEVDKLWARWRAALEHMQAIAERRGWQVVPLTVDPPASEAELLAFEMGQGMRIPSQLRRLLACVSCRVAFGWDVPTHLQPFEYYRFPFGSSLRDHVWDLGWIGERAIPNFAGWKRDNAATDISEAPNTPAMWEHQFPIGEFINGDMLTIDVTAADGPQPVRYFSHELEGIHATAVAPDLFSFISTLATLGWAGTEQDSWFPFLEAGSDRTRYLSTTTAGAKAWLAWVEEGQLDSVDQPPAPILATTPADVALLDAAYANSLDGVAAALAAGARPDVIGDDAWTRAKETSVDLDFATAVTLATMVDNVAMLELLVAKGATLDTRRLPVAEAVWHGALPTLHWLIAHKARVDGWPHDRYWPIHRLVAQRGQVTPETEARDRADLVRRGITGIAAARQLTTAVDTPTYLAMLNALLDAGAQPDAPWDNGLTMLMYGGAHTAEALLAHGADVTKRDSSGQTALFMANTGEKVRLLVAHGAKINILSTPRADDVSALAQTPLQVQISLRRWSKDRTIVPTLLGFGADPKIRDGKGRSTLAYCGTVEDMKLISAYGLDPHERMPDGATLIHNTAWQSMRPVAEDREIIDYLLGLGIDINARKQDGQTFLHLVAPQELTQPEDIVYLLGKGADKTIRDAAGRRPFDLVPGSKAEVRDLLR